MLPGVVLGKELGGTALAAWGVQLPLLHWLALEQNAGPSSVFVKAELSSDFFWFVKRGTNVGLL